MFAFEFAGPSFNFFKCKKENMVGMTKKNEDKD